MPGRFARNGFVRRSLSPLDRGRIPLPGWFVDCLTLWGLATGMLSVLLVLPHTAFAPFILLGSAVPALLGAWIFLFNAIDLLRVAGEQLATKRNYTVVPVTGDLRYVASVVAAGKRWIGAAHPSARTVATRVGENAAALSVLIRRRSDGKSSFCGYMLLYPLKHRIGELVEEGAIRSEAELGPDPLLADFDSARFVYVAMVYGSDRHARWQVKESLRAAMTEVLASGRVERVFARPGTAFGESLMQEYGFTPIADRRGVWSVEGARLRRRLRVEAALNSSLLMRADGVDSEQVRPGRA